MPITDYQAKYLAYELTRRCPTNSVEKLAGAVAGAQVDLNPHQVDAALFAFRSPLSKGAILWAEDLKVGLAREIREIDKLIREAKKATTMAMSLEDKLAGQKSVKELENRRASRRRALFEEQDRIDAERDKLIKATEKRLRLETNTLQELFCVRWTLA